MTIIAHEPLTYPARKVRLEVIEQRAHLAIPHIRKPQLFSDDLAHLSRDLLLLNRSLPHCAEPSRHRLRDAFNYASISPDNYVRFDSTHTTATIHGTYDLVSLAAKLFW